MGYKKLAVIFLALFMISAVFVEAQCPFGLCPYGGFGGYGRFPGRGYAGFRGFRGRFPYGRRFRGRGYGRFPWGRGYKWRG